MKTPQVDGDRLQQQIDQLAAISAAPAPVVTRVLFSEADLRARAYVKKLCQEAGLSLREDAVGNIFARWAGQDPNLPAVATGSHIDAIPNAGRYDGVVGVLGAIEAIERRYGTIGNLFQPLQVIKLVVRHDARNACCQHRLIIVPALSARALCFRRGRLRP